MMYLFKEKYFNTRKDEIMTEKIVRRLTNFCIYLINEIAKGDIEKENEILRDENRRLRLIVSAYEDLTQKYFVDLRKVKTKVMFDEKNK